VFIKQEGKVTHKHMSQMLRHEIVCGGCLSTDAQKNLVSSVQVSQPGPARGEFDFGFCGHFGEDGECMGKLAFWNIRECDRDDFIVEGFPEVLYGLVTSAFDFGVRTLEPGFVNA
jgi:hypothetical protein